MSSDSMDANAAGCCPEIISNEVDGQYADASVPVFVAQPKAMRDCSGKGRPQSQMEPTAKHVWSVPFERAFLLMVLCT